MQRAKELAERLEDTRRTGRGTHSASRPFTLVQGDLREASEQARALAAVLDQVARRRPAASCKELERPTILCVEISRGLTGCSATLGVFRAHGWQDGVRLHARTFWRSRWLVRFCG